MRLSFFRVSLVYYVAKIKLYALGIFGKVGTGIVGILNVGSMKTVNLPIPQALPNQIALCPLRRRIPRSGFTGIHRGNYRVCPCCVKFTLHLITLHNLVVLLIIHSLYHDLFSCCENLKEFFG